MNNILLKTIDTAVNVAMVADPDYGHNPNFLKSGAKVPEVILKISNGTEMSLSSLLKHGQVLLVFIKGTWCPFCRLHMMRLRAWSTKLSNKNVSLIVVSTESADIIRGWLKKNPYTYLFASDDDQSLGKIFGVNLDDKNHTQAATFLIDIDSIVKASFTEKRTNGLGVDLD
ncbi:MAG: peroxiredoxin family protein [Bacteriovoracaceae bacterium]